MEIEIEIKILASSGEEHEIFSVLQSEMGFGKIHFGNLDALSLHDTYYDTTNTILEKNGLYLRIRQNMSLQNKIITLRGFTAIGAKILKVSEVNSPLSDESFGNALLALSRFIKVPQREPALSTEAMSLDQSFSRIGLRKIVELDNFRSEYLLYLGEINIGRICFDEVLFDIKGLARSFREIELKLKEDYVSQIQNVLVELTRSVGAYFQSSSITKLERALSLKRSAYN